MRLTLQCRTSVAGAAMPAQQLARPSWQPLTPHDSQMLLPLKPVRPLASGGELGFGQPLVYQSLVRHSLKTASHTLHSVSGIGWTAQAPRQRSVTQRASPAGRQWQFGVHAYAFTEVTYHELPLVLPQLSVDRFATRPTPEEQQAGELYISAAPLLDLGDGPYVPQTAFSWGGVRLKDLPAAPMAAIGQLRSYQPPARERNTVTPWGAGQSLYHVPKLPYKVEPVPVEPVPPYQPDRRITYIIMRSLNCTALPGGEPLQLADINISCDLDTFSWRLSAQVLGQASMDLLKADAGGNRELLVEINGHTWRFFVGSYESSRRVSDSSVERRWSITGYSVSQYLAAPYAPKRTRSISNTTAVQAATDELFGTGFALQWDTSLLSDWMLPNAVYSYQELTPMSAIKRLAEAVGAVVQADLIGPRVVVMPRYKVPPWRLLYKQMDRTIFEGQVLSEGGRRDARSLINSVLVSGEQEGVAMTVTRLNTPGDKPGADVVEAWLSDEPANRARGLHEIASGGDWDVYTLELAIPESNAQPGLLLPGHTVAMVNADNSEAWRGYVTSTSISAPGKNSPKVRQSVTVEVPVSHA